MAPLPLYKPVRIDGQRFPWGIAHLVDGVPHFRTINDHLLRYPTEEAAQIAADQINTKIREAARDYMEGVHPPVMSEHGTLRWPVALKDYPSSHAHVNIDHGQYRGKDRLSLTGIPWTLSAQDAEIVARAMQNAAKWLQLHPDPYHQKEG